MEEAKLIEEIQAGSEKAFKLLFMSYKDRVYNTCLGFLPNRDDAEDALQEVFIYIYKSAKKFKGDSSLSTWIYRISVNTCLEIIRSRKRKKRRFFFEQKVNIEDYTWKISDPFNHPGISLENKEKAAIIFKAIGTLPNNQRTAFTLQKVDGLSYKEIVDIMQLSQSSVESLIHRAKKNLQKKLLDYYKNKKF